MYFQGEMSFFVILGVRFILPHEPFPNIQYIDLLLALFIAFFDNTHIIINTCLQNTQLFNDYFS